MRDSIVSQSATHMMIPQSQTRWADHVFVWECCLSRASWSANSCLASRDTRLGLGGGGGRSEISKSREGRRKNSKTRATETRIHCCMCTKTWHTWSEMKWILWAELHVMLEQDHHLFSTRSTTPHCAATAKARLSSTLSRASTAMGGKAWAAAERWLALSVSRPSDNSVQWTSEGKVLQRMYQHRTAFIKEICFLTTNLGTQR